MTNISMKENRNHVMTGDTLQLCLKKLSMSINMFLSANIVTSKFESQISFSCNI